MFTKKIYQDQQMQPEANMAAGTVREGTDMDYPTAINSAMGQNGYANNIAAQGEGHPDQDQLPDIKVVNADAAILEVPEDERAEDLGPEADELAKVKEQGYFSPVRGMVNIQGRLDGKLYAQKYIDQEGKGFIQYIEKYSDGSCSPRMSIAQSDMIIAGRYQFSGDNANETFIRKKIRRFITKAYEDYAGKFRGMPEDALDFGEILSTLMAAMPHLPVFSDEPTGDEKEEFYRELISRIEDSSMSVVYTHKAYYALIEESVSSIAREMGLKKREFLQKLKNFGFLYLTESSRGFQTNVRFRMQDGSSHTEWCYCVYKLKYFADIRSAAEKG